MPKYQAYFDTVNGEIHHVVDIDDDEVLGIVESDILYELHSRGNDLKGEGVTQVVANGHALDRSLPLPNQGVRPNDVLRFSRIPENG